MKGETYNGWKNYETWAVKLHWDNQEWSYNHQVALAKHAKEKAKTHDTVVKSKIWTIKEAEKFLLADLMREETERIIDNHNVRAGKEMSDLLAMDLMNAALSEVDWNEIAENILSMIEEG